MSNKINFAALSDDILKVFSKHGLLPNGFAVSVTISKEDFDSLAIHHQNYLHPEHKPGLILVTEGGEIQWSVQVLREISSDDIQYKSRF